MQPNLLRTISIRAPMQRLHVTPHFVSHVAEVHFTDEGETLFLAIFACVCCPNKQQWLSRDRLVAEFNVNQSRLYSLEQQARKDLRERQAELNSKAIRDFLNFEDSTADDGASY